MRTIVLYIICAAVAVGGAGCSATRECAKPELNMPESFAHSDNDSLALADIDWFEFYSDPALRDILKATLANNRDFLAAAAKVEELRNLYGVSAAAMLPEIGGHVYWSQETNDYRGEKHLTDPEHGIKARLNWEVDLWGNLRWGKKRDKAAWQASVEDQRALQITLIAEAASAYYRLVALDNELLIVRQALDTRSEELEKAKLRYEGGLTSEIVYLQAQVEYNTAASLVPDVERRISLTENAILLLMGEYAGGKVVRSSGKLEQLPERPLPIGLPSELLTRRPDLRASEMRLCKALANVGVSYTDRFPKLTLRLTGGVENNDIGGIFKSPFTYVIGSLTGPIFDFGKRKRKYKAAVAAYEQARLGYEQDVMTAFGEVVDALTSYRKCRETTASRADLRQAAEKYVELAHLQYRAGSINYLDVLDAQRRYLDSAIGFSNAVRDEMLSLVGLYKSLGGGWVTN